ncbi:DHA2 family efflux MFS transporter permease subunit [Actinoallomurus iriomotensis]|uniref:MFS transporter n=1 Tax=Actinoallomurus iriomotensis TaxID=478107 RepID=A0A9W6S495_9ACTN|nr:DHA2 family efflux MFS transporter permease subunit [Actinoallomurus iriomotensis]GLY86804.1 MFS transporter [Actinoallomurus iriomotensis]
MGRSPSAGRPKRANPWIALTVLNLGLFMTLLDVTIVNVAIPRMIDDIHASLDEAAWVSNAYVLAFAVLLVTAGRLGDIFGPRLLFLVGTAVFTVASLLCGVAGDPGTLIAFRAAQGVGAALLTPQPLAIVHGLFPPERRGSAFAVNGIVGGLATLAGPLAGGVLVTHLSWRWVFFVNVPVGVLSIAAAGRLVPDLRTGRRHRLDITGVVLASLGLLALTFGLTEGERYGWGTIGSFISIPLILATGVALLACFGWQQAQRQAGEPLMPFRLFRDRTFASMTGVGALLQLVFVGHLLPFTIYLQSVLGLSALQAGLVTAPAAAVNALLALFLGLVVDRHGTRGVLVGGLLAFACGIVLMTVAATVGQSPWAFVPAMIIIGAGFSATFSPMITAAMAVASPRDAGAASGMLNTGRQLGAVLGSALITALLQNRLAAGLRHQAVTRTAALPSDVRDRVIAGFSTAARSGLQVGSDQSGAPVPSGVPAAYAGSVHRLSADIYRHAYVGALRPTLLMCAALLVIATLCALTARADRGHADPNLPEDRTTTGRLPSLPHHE